MYQEINGNLIDLANESRFDVIAHGCNCFCTMGAGIAPQMARAFSADTFRLEDSEYKGDITKLGTIDWAHTYIGKDDRKVYNRAVVKPWEDAGYKKLVIVNAYTQYHYGRNHVDGVSTPIDYEALTLCMRKINHVFKGKHIGLPKIGAGLAGGDWERIKNIIQTEFVDCDVTIVIFK